MESAATLKLFVVLCRTFSTVSEAAKKDIKTYGLSLSEFSVLELLYHKGAKNIQEIGGKVLLTSGSMTYVINQMVKKGLVTRKICKQDKRVIYVELSEKGRLLLKEIFPSHKRCISQLFDTLSAEQITNLTDDLKQISTAIRDKENKKC